MGSDQRRSKLFKLIVEVYIRTAQPVSSSSLARQHPELQVSSATLRVMMAEMEAEGLLRQPHAMSGRVPTERGLRTYLDGLVGMRLHPQDRTRLQAALAVKESAQTYPAALGQALSGLTRQTVVLAMPRFLGSRLRELGLVKCGPRRILAYFVSPNGLVQQKVVDVDRDIESCELEQVQNYLNARLANRTLKEVRALVASEVEAAHATHDALRSHAVAIGAALLPDLAEAEWEVLVEGASHLLEQPEFADLRQLRALMRTLEEKEALLRLLDQILDTQGVVVMLGSEHRLRSAPDLACVGCAFEGGGQPTAAISVLGPTRMNYGRLVPMVQYATELFGQFWEQI